MVNNGNYIITGKGSMGYISVSVKHSLPESVIFCVSNHSHLSLSQQYVERAKPHTQKIENIY